MSGAIQISEERGVRYLHFGSRWIQGAMRLARPYVLELEYTREMMLPLLLRPDGWPRRVLQIGLGAASLTRFLWRHRPRAELEVVEVREDVVHAAYQFFKLPDDPQRVAIVLGDGAAHVAQGDASYDLILIDGYDARGRVGALDTVAFYAQCRRRLVRGGLLATNLLSRHGLEASVARMREAFDGEALALPPCKSGNVVVLAAHEAELDLDPGELATRAVALRLATGLDLAGTIARLAGAATPVPPRRDARR